MGGSRMAWCSNPSCKSAGVEMRVPLPRTSLVSDYRCQKCSQPLGWEPRATASPSPSAAPTPRIHKFLGVAAVSSLVLGILSAIVLANIFPKSWLGLYALLIGAAGAVFSALSMVPRREWRYAAESLLRLLRDIPKGAKEEGKKLGAAIDRLARGVGWLVRAFLAVAGVLLLIWVLISAVRWFWDHPLW